MLPILREQPSPAIAADPFDECTTFVTKPVLNDAEEGDGIFLVPMEITGTAPYDAYRTFIRAVDARNPNSFHAIHMETPQLCSGVFQLILDAVSTPSSISLNPSLDVVSDVRPPVVYLKGTNREKPSSRGRRNRTFYRRLLCWRE